MPDDLSPQILQGIISIWAARERKEQESERESEKRLSHSFCCHMSLYNTLTMAPCRYIKEHCAAKKHYIRKLLKACLHTALVEYLQSGARVCVHCVSEKAMETFRASQIVNAVSISILNQTFILSIHSPDQSNAIQAPSSKCSLLEGNNAHFWLTLTERYSF